MSQGPPVNLEYQPGPRNRPGPAYLVSRLISSYIGYALIMTVLVLIVPRFEQVFRDFKATVPGVTTLLIFASRLCTQYYLWAILIPLPAIWAVGNANIPDSRLRRWLRVAAFIFVVLFLIYSLIALFRPLMLLIKSLAGP